MQEVVRAVSELQPGQELIVGSGTEADVVIDTDEIDQRHARFILRDGVIHVQDLDSRAGTFVNHNEVRGLIPLAPGDRVRLGSLEVVLESEVVTRKITGDGSRSEDQSAGVDLTLKGATKVVSFRDGRERRQRAILDDVSMHVRAGEFVGILGGSGSGKTTLINVIAGLTDLSQGTILLDRRPVDQRTLQCDQRIAYLPQDVVIHESLTPRAALGYIARLKRVGSSEEDRDRKIQEALHRVGVDGRMDVPIQRLSGGQRKRVALAAELLGDPQVILLDEATSGLDPGTEEEMMRLFRSLADEGKTVICITHFPIRLSMCDQLLYLIDGKAVFYGPPDELTRFFGTDSIKDVYVRQNDRSADDWRATFRESSAGRTVESEIPTAILEPVADAASDRPVSRDQLVGQTQQLVQRYFELQRTDWQYLLLLFVQAPVIALMIAATFGDIRASFAELHAADTKEVIFVLVVAMLWCSGTASVREVVKEETILRHEMRFGVRLVSYLLSKLLLLSAFSLVQAFLLLLIVRYFTQMTGLFEAQFLVLVFTAAVGVVLGLLVSSFAGTSERAMTILPVLLIAQAIFSGGLARLDGAVRTFAQLFVPAYWSLDGIRSTFGSALRNATYPGVPGHFQPPILGPGGPLSFDLLALALQTTLLAGITYLVLHSKLNRSFPQAPLRFLTARILRAKS